MAQRVEYIIGVDADTSKLESSLQKALSSLNDIGKLKGTGAITSDLGEAAAAAQKLQMFLESAINTNTGKLDLSKFSASLQQSGLSIQDYANKLQAIGVQGQEAFLSVASAVAKAEIPIKRQSKLLQELFTTMKNTVRWQITSTALNSFTGALQTAYYYAKDLNKSLTDIRIVSNKSASDMAQFAEEATKAAKALSTTTTDYTDASLIYYQQGLSDQEVSDRTETTIKMANVAGITAETASEQLTAIWNNFYDGSKNLEYYADVMVKLGAATASSSDEISEGIEKFAAAAGTIGLSYDYAASALATVTAQTRESASVVGTAFRTLFSRIQGLQQGETLDDGTTLNKYSEALAKVGVNIKDTSGELKDMDTILDELGSKWSTLAKDQQIALAETVAGVRQWTQLVALMDSWDFFQENLAIAQGSSGSLEEQAQIYAESWEAARDRVKASAEEIYNTLINPDFFIDLDNTITPVLSGLANVLEAMGGMKGLILTIGRSFTAVFRDQITKGLKDLAYNFTVLVGKANETQRITKEQFGEAAIRLARDSTNSSNVTVERKKVQAEDIEMQNLLNTQARKMTEEQYTQLSNYKNIITAIKEMAVEYRKAVQDHEEESQRLTTELLNTGGGAAKQSSQYTSAIEEVKKLNIPGLKDSADFEVNRKTGNNTIQAMLKAYKQLSSTSGGLDRLKAQMESLSEEDSNNIELLESIKTRYKDLTGIDLGNSDLQTGLDAINNSINEIDSVLDTLFTTLENNHYPTEELRNLGDAAQYAGEATQNGAHSTEISASQYARFAEQVFQATVEQRNWATIVVDSANQLMQLGMMIQSIQNLGSIWNDDDLTTGEKVVQALTSISMLAPQVISLIGSITKTQKSYNAVQLQGVLTQEQAAAAIGLTTGQQIVHTKVVNGNTVAVVANTKAWYKFPLTWVLAGVTAVVAAFTIYNTILEENTKRRKENAEQQAEEANKTAEANKEERESVEELYKSYINLKNLNDTTVEGKEELKEKTKELCEALNVEWDAVAALNNEYEELNKHIAENNRASVQKAYDDNEKNIKAQKTLMLEESTNVDRTVDDFSYVKQFDSGFLASDEEVFRDKLLEMLQPYIEEGKVIAETDKTLDFRLNFDSADDFYEIIGAFLELKTEILGSEDEEWVKIRNESEVYADWVSWLGEIESEYETITALEEDRLQYAEELAQAEAAVMEQDLNDVDTLEEYQEYKKKYVEKLKEIIPEDLVPDDYTGTIEEYYNELADSYLSGYDHLTEIVSESNIYDALVEKLGSQGEEKLDTLLSWGFDLDTLGRLTDWDALNKELDNYFEKIEELTSLGYDTKEIKIGNIDLGDSRGKIEWNGFNLAQFYNQLKAIGYEDIHSLLGTTSTVMGASGQYEDLNIAYTPLLQTEDGLVPLDQDTIDNYIFGLINQAKEEYGNDWGNHLLEFDSQGLEIEGQKISNLIAAVGDNAEDAAQAMHYLGNDGALALQRLNTEAEIQFQLQKQLSKLVDDSAGNLIEKLQNGDLTQDNITDDEDYQNLLSTLELLKKAYPELEADAIVLSKTWEVGSQTYLEALGNIQDKINKIELKKLSEEAKEAKEEVKHWLNSSDLEAKIKANPDKFLSTVDDLLDADYTIDIEIHAQSEEAFKEITNAMSDIEDEASKIGENFVVAASDVRDLNNTFPGIIEGMTDVGDGSVQLSQTVVENAIAAAKGEIAAQAESVVNQLDQQATLLEGKQKVYQQMAEAAQVLAGAETDSEMTASQARAKISAGLSELTQLNSEAATTTELNNQEKTADSSNDNSEVTAQNWNSAFKSAAKSSATFARAAIKNMKAVADNDLGSVSDGKFKVDYQGRNGVSAEADVLKETQDVLDNVDSVSQNVWAELAAKYQSLANAAGRSANDIRGMIAGIGTNVTELDYLLGNVSKGLGTKGSKDSGSDGDASKEKFEEALERYHEITREIEYQKELLSDLEEQIDRTYGTKRLDLYSKKIEKLNHLAELEQQKSLAALAYVLEDQNEIEKLGLSPQINKESLEITNYTELLKQAQKEYQAYLDKWNAMTKAQQEAKEEEKEAAEQLYNDRVEALEQYEESVNTYREEAENFKDYLRQVEDSKLQAIVDKLEFVIDTKELKAAAQDFVKSIEEIFGDVLTHGEATTRINAEQAQAEIDMLPHYQEQYNDLQNLLANATDYTDITAIQDQLSDLQGQIIDSGTSLLEFINSIEDIIPDAVSAVADRFAVFTDQLDHNTSILDTVKELYALQGATYKTDKGFRALQSVAQEQLDASVASAELQRQYYLDMLDKLVEAQAKLDSLNGDEQDIRWDTYKKERDAYLEQVNSAQEAYLQQAQTALEALRDMFTTEIEEAVYDFNKALAGVNYVNLDLLQSSYDNYTEEDERYFDKVNEAYQVAAWYNKLQADIDDSTNTIYKNRLKALQEEIDLRREGGTLSQYDLDILNAKYQLLQAEMALEDARNAKNEIRLVRDRQGNWNYQYTANADAIADAEAEVLDAQNDWYNIAKDQTESTAGEIVAMWKECTEEIQQLYTDLANGDITEEEYLKKKAEIEGYYKEKSIYLEREKQVAIKDMSEAGYESLKDIAEKSGETVQDFQNVYAENLEEMTKNNTDFAEMLDNTLQQCEDDYDSYQEKVDEVKVKTGSSWEDLATQTDQVSTAIDILRQRGEEAAESLSSMLGVIQNLSDEQLTLAQNIWASVEAYKNLANSVTSFVTDAQGGKGYDAGTDYSAVIIDGIVNGWLKYGDSNYQELIGQRNAKISDLGLTVQQGSAADDRYKNATAAIGEYTTKEEWIRKMQELGILSFGTGGYTGTFDDQRLAFLHQKELVLNQEDTENILAAVQLARNIGSDFFSSIEKALDGEAVAAMSLMGQRLSPIVAASAQDSIEQTIHIDKIEFPNVTSRTEIEEAFINLSNDAAQWSRRRS